MKVSTSKRLKAESEKYRAESKKQKVESEKYKTESIKQKVGGSLVPRAGLYTTSPRAITLASLLWAFRFYPCRGVLLTFMMLLTMQVSAQIISLDSMLSLIDKRNPMLQEYDSKVKALDAYSEGAKSWMAPMLGVGTFMTPYPGQRVMEQRDKGFVMFSVEQNIPNPAKLNANRNYLRSKSAVEQQGRYFAYNTLRAEAKTLYYQNVVLYKKVKVLEQNKDIIQLMVKLAQIRYPYNQGSISNIYKAEGRLLEVENMILMTTGEIEENNFRLKSLMNLPKESTISTDTTVQTEFASTNLNYDTAALQSQRSDIKQIESNIEAMSYNLKLQSYQSKPDFRIRFDHMSPIGNSMPNQFTLMGMVSIPIAPWSSKSYRSEIKGMQYDIEAMKKSQEAIVNETRGALAGMSVQITRMQQQLDNYNKKIIPALQKNYQTLMLSYEENREQLPIVIDGWEALNMVQMEYLNKLEAYYLMIVNYEKELEK